MTKSKIFSILFMIFLFCLIPNVVSAANITTETETLDLTSDRQTEDKLSTKGWKWDNENKTLTLKNANFETKDENSCIKLKKADDITIIFEGKNTLKSEKKAVIYADGGDKINMGGSLTLKGKNGGVLNLEVTVPSDARWR